MNKSELLKKGLLQIAIGYILILVHIKISFFDILPDFIGYFLILSGINKLKDEVKSLSLIKPFCTVLLVWSVISIFSIYVSAEFSSIFTVITLIMSIINIYFNFQLITDISIIAEKYQKENDTIDKKLKIRRNILTVLSSAFTAVSLFSSVLMSAAENEILLIVLMILTVVDVIAALSVVSAILSLRRTLDISDDSENDLKTEPS